MLEMFQAWLATNLIPILFVVILAVLAERFGTAILATLIQRSLRRHTTDDRPQIDVKKRQDTLIGIASTLLRIVVWLTVVYSVAQRFGIDPAPLLASASIIGLALSFGAQSLVKDFVSGMFIIVENQYRVGDTVVLDGANGTVEKVSIRTTVVRDDEGSVHYIPNGTINHAVNKTMGYAKINMVLSVKPKTDIDKLAKTINDIGAKMAEDEKWGKRLLQPPRFVNISNFSASTLDVKITGKTSASSQASVTGELRRRLLSALDKNEIELAGSSSAAAVSTKKK